MTSFSFGMGSHADDNNNNANTYHNNEQEEIVMDDSTPWMGVAEGNLALLQASMQRLQLYPTAADEHGYTLLHAAISYNHLHIAEWLVEQQLQRQQQQDQDEQDPERPSSSSVYDLIHAVDSEGDSALHYATTVEACQWLVQQQNMNVSIRNHENKTALECKRDELHENMQDEDEYDEDDDENVQLRSMIAFLSGVIDPDDHDNDGAGAGIVAQ